MSTITETSTSTSTSTRNGKLAAAGILASAACTYVGTFFDLTDNESGSDHSIGDYLFVLGIAGIAAAVVFGLVVRTAAQGNPSRRAAILGVVGLLSIAVFWSGLPMVLVAGAVACALADKDRLGSFGVGSKVGLALSAVTTAGAVALAIAG